MNECPNSDCKERQDGHHTTLFGKDGMSGLVSCMGKKLSRNTALVVILALVGSASGVTVYGLDSLKQDRAVVAENKQEIGNMKANLEWIKVTVEENHQNLNDIKKQIDEIQMTPGQLKKLITDAVKKGNIKK